MDNFDIVPYLLNERNKKITKKFIEGKLLEYGIKHKVKNLELFQHAMTHRSYIVRDPEYIKANIKKYQYMVDDQIEKCPTPDKAVPLQSGTYERLEFLGDSVIHLVVAEYLYDRYPNEYEGFMTKLRTKIENGEQLATMCKILGLDEYILISRQVENKNGRDINISILEDVFEGFIASLFLDSDRDFNKCKKFITTFIEKEIDFACLLFNETNYKDSLLKYHHSLSWKDPVYKFLKAEGMDHNKTFYMVVLGKNSVLYATGVGNTKKNAEQDAAKQALIKYEQIETHKYIDDQSETSSISEYSILSDGE